MQNLQLEQYFSGVLRILSGLGDGHIEQQDLDYARRNSVGLTASITYHNGSRIRVRLIINTDSDYPELHSYPHHKHEGADEQVTASRQPSVRQIRDEIAAYLE